MVIIVLFGPGQATLAAGSPAGATGEVVIAAQFVNPYTFLPFSTQPPVRSAPKGHDGRSGGGLLSGLLRVRITARTPLLVRGFGFAPGSEVEGAPSRPDGAGGRESILPGSSVAGAVRSLHEALTNSCLRVFDGDLVPQYRQQADPYRIGRLRLAVVEAAGEVVDERQRPPRLRLCERGDPVTHRLEQAVLERLHRVSGLRSGDRLTITCDGEDRPVSAERGPDGDWVLFLSDAGARPDKFPYRAHVRRLTERRVSVGQDAWADYLDLVEGADDLRPARLRQVPETQRFVPVTHRFVPVGGRARDVVVGERHLVRRTVVAGQPLWVQLAEDGNSAVVVQPAMIWREFGAGSAGERIPPGFAPCADPKHLCPACRLFGSVDLGGRSEDGRARQRSYRGHVRFGDAVAASPRLLEVTLPPLGGPRPGAGQHYLETEEWAGDGSVPPLREWGSIADAPGAPRRLRGRKFYWHTTVANKQLPRRGKARPGHGTDNEMVSRAQVFAIDSVFEATIAFTDLDDSALGALIATLQPHRLLGEAAVVHIGGGKPLGYGSCRIEIDHEHSWCGTARDRYTGIAPTALDQGRAHALVARFAADDASAHVRKKVWPLLAKAVAMDHVRPRDVWYPPGATEVGDKNFDQGFPYWKQTSGWESDRKGAPQGYPLQPLPGIDAASQQIDIVTGNQQRPLRRHPRSR